VGPRGRGRGSALSVGGNAVPTYDYRCDRCERTFEVRQRISAEPLTTCERCGGSIRRLLAAAPFILKGGGWYVTDYPSEGRKKGIEAEKKSSGEAATSPASTAPGTDGASSKTAAPTEKAGVSTDASASKAAPAPTS
jgi:putative FmdB family regulatory protein